MTSAYLINKLINLKNKLINRVKIFII